MIPAEYQQAYEKAKYEELKTEYKHKKRANKTLLTLLFLAFLTIGALIYYYENKSENSSTTDDINVTTIENSKGINYVLELNIKKEGIPSKICFAPYRITYTDEYILYDNEFSDIIVSNGTCYIVSEEYIECYSEFNLFNISER